MKFIKRLVLLPALALGSYALADSTPTFSGECQVKGSPAVSFKVDLNHLTTSIGSFTLSDGSRTYEASAWLTPHDGKYFARLNFHWENGGKRHLISVTTADTVPGNRLYYSEKEYDSEHGPVTDDFSCKGIVSE